MKHLKKFLTSKSEEKPLMVLDSILVYLFKTYYTSTTKIEVKEFIFNRYFTFKVKPNRTLIEIANSNSESNERDLFNNRTEEAIKYLIENDFISLEDNNICLTYKGVIQYHKGFVKEFLFDRHKTILDVYNVYISIVLTVVGLLLGLYIGK